MLDERDVEAAVTARGEGTLSEVEAELLLWDRELSLLELIPPKALLCICRANWLTVGDAAAGGAAAQLELTNESLVCLVDEEYVVTPDKGRHKPAADATKGAPPLPPSPPSPLHLSLFAASLNAGAASLLQPPPSPEAHPLGHCNPLSSIG